ncbi:unnamed protein product [Prunus armeniaca]
MSVSSNGLNTLGCTMHTQREREREAWECGIVVWLWFSNPPRGYPPVALRQFVIYDYAVRGLRFKLTNGPLRPARNAARMDLVSPGPARIAAQIEVLSLKPARIAVRAD